MRRVLAIPDRPPQRRSALGKTGRPQPSKENVYPRKERSENKIDGAIALIMAIGRHMVFEDKPNIDDFLANAIVV